MSFEAQYILIRGLPFGDLQIRYYGIIIVLALLVGAFVAARLAKRSKLDPDHIWGGLTWAIIPGIVLARLWFVLFPPVSLTAQCDPEVAAAVMQAGRTPVCMDTAWFLQNFFNLENGAIAIWSGGLSIFGAVLGGLLGAYIYMRRNKLPVGTWLDVAAVAIPLSQAIGRWANFVNQELYGLPTTLPWGLGIDRAHRVGIYTNMVEYDINTRFHPLFLYESLWSILAFIVLLNLYQRYRHRLLPGDLFLICVGQYAVIRFLLEFLRVEVAYIPGTTINSSQAFTVLIFVVALAFFFYRRRAGGQPAAPEAAAGKTAKTG